MSVVEPSTTTTEATAATTEAASTATPSADPLRSGLDAAYDKLTSQAGTADSAAATTATNADEAQGDPANQDGAPQNTAEAPQAEPEKIVVTDEQLADSKYWGSLDKDGWARMERDYPVQAKLVKSSQAAGTRIVNEARQEAERILSEARTSTATSATRSDASPSDEPSPELIAAVERSQSLDPVEAAKGYLDIQRLTMPHALKEQGFDPDAKRQEAIDTEAMRIALTEAPDIRSLDFSALDAIVDGSPVLTALVKTNTPQNIALAMVAARNELVTRNEAAKAAQADAQRKADAAAKEKARQETVRSNARTASATITGGKPGNANAKPTLRQRLSEVADRVAPDMA